MRPLRRLLLGAAAAALLGIPGLAAQQVSGPLVVFNAGSLAYPFRELLNAFTKMHPAVRPMQESSGSLEAARKLTELGKIPDVLGVADYGVIAKLLMPSHARWYVTFASNAMVLSYTDRSAGAREINGQNWWRILLRPGVRVGRSDPSLDPNGYRALMVYQLAEVHYRQPGLAARLLAASPARYVRPKEADLTALVQAGELDYAWSYRSLAMTAGLRGVTLPPEIDLSDPAKAAQYAQAKVRLPGLDFVGEPIVYALTIPVGAPHAATARAFVRFALSPAGREILVRSGFQVLPKPLLAGDSAGAAVIP